MLFALSWAIFYNHTNRIGATREVILKIPVPYFLE